MIISCLLLGIGFVFLMVYGIYATIIKDKLMYLVYVVTGHMCSSLFLGTAGYLVLEKTHAS